MLDDNGNRIIQIFYCPKCERDKGYKSKGFILGKCKVCGSKINYTFENIEEQDERNAVQKR